MPCTDQRFPGNCAGLLMHDCMGLAAGYHLLMPEACRTVQYFSPEIKRSRNWDLCEHNYEIMTSIFIENELIRMKLHEIIEGWMKGKPARGRRRIQMLYDLAIWWWLCCTQMGSWGQRGMETQRKDVKNLLYSRRLLMMKQSGTHSEVYSSWNNWPLNGEQTTGTIFLLVDSKITARH